jgi:hypothetical protein
MQHDFLTNGLNQDPHKEKLASVTYLYRTANMWFNYTYIKWLLNFVSSYILYFRFVVLVAVRKKISPLKCDAIKFGRQ